MSAEHSGVETLVQVTGVEVRFGDNRVLDGVDLRVRRGEIVTLIGPNGSGKSTLVRVVLGLIRPDRGTVSLYPDLRIGYMPQRLTLDPVLPLSVQRFLTLGVPARRPQVLAALEEVGAPSVIDRPVHGLSGGQLQRVLVARALLREPDLLVLDEPVQGVDISGQRELYTLIARLRQHRGCAVLMVSHDLHLVMAATDQVVCLNHHVCCAGRPDAVSRDPAYLTLFGAALPHELAIYTHHHNHDHAPDGRVLPRDTPTRPRYPEHG